MINSTMVQEVNLSEPVVLRGGLDYIRGNLWLYAPYIGLFSLGIGAGICGNLLIIGTILFVPKLRQSPTFVMILNLSLSDLTVSVAVDSFTLVGTLAGEEFFIQSPFWCQFSGAMCIIACGTSLVSMGFLAVNRYVCIIHPSFYRKMFTMNKTICYCLLGWATGIAFNVPNFIPGWAEYNFDAKELTCSSDRTKKVYATVFASAGILLPCLAMAFCYLRIFCFAYQAKAKLAGKSKAEAFRLAKSLFASFALFALCWVPLAVMLLLDTDDRMSTEMHMYLFVLAHLNSALNPIFYAAFNPKIKESYKHFLNFVSFGLLYPDTDRRRLSALGAATLHSQAKSNKSNKS